MRDQIRNRMQYSNDAKAVFKALSVEMKEKMSQIETTRWPVILNRIDAPFFKLKNHKGIW